MNHDLKTWPVFFEAQMNGTKPFEIRRHDRNYALGDTFTSREYAPTVNAYTGRTITYLITYLMAADTALVPGLMPGYCILGLRRISDVAATIPAAPAPRPTDQRTNGLRATVLETSPVSQIVQDERGEIHTLTGDQMEPTAEPGTIGVLVASGSKLAFIGSIS